MTAPTSDLFSVILAREAGSVVGLTPRLPTPFEDLPTAEELDPVAPSPVGTAGSGASGAGAPPTGAPAPRADPPRDAVTPTVGRRRELVRIEERVQVEALEAVPSPAPSPARTQSPDVPGQRRETGQQRDVDREPEPLRRAAASGDQVPALHAPAAPPTLPVAQADAPVRDGRASVRVRVRPHDPAPAALARQTEMATTHGPAGPVVHVSIARVEVRAVAEPVAPRARRTERRTETLDDYLDRRNRGSRA